jgi:hypothetical protein
MIVQLKKLFIINSLFAISMAFLEAAVVYYLRMLYYPEGFAFPLKMMELNVATVEIAREIATLLMLITVAYLSARTFIEVFAWFIFNFAVWDIFYYVFLYLTLSWPESLLTMDILFLIPLTWVGPVLAPVLNSIMMITLAIIILIKSKLEKDFNIGIFTWLFLVAGSLIVIYAYVKDYTRFMIQDFSLPELIFPGETADAVIIKAMEYIPQDFNWYFFSLGALLHAIAILRLFLRKPDYLSKW